MKPRGMKELEKYQKDFKKLSYKQAIIAKCAECMGNYRDGKVDCFIPECPLYPYMPYGQAWKNREKNQKRVKMGYDMHRK